MSRTEQKKNYDIGAKTLKPLQNDDTVRIQSQDKSWQPVFIVNKHDERSYTVRIGDGTQYIRNHHHLLKTNESLCQKSKFDSFADILDHKDTNLNCTLNSPTFSGETVVHNSQNFKVPVNNTNEHPSSYIARFCFV